MEGGSRNALFDGPRRHRRAARRRPRHLPRRERRLRLLPDDELLERLTHEEGERDDLLHPLRIDAVVAAVAVQERHGSLSHDDGDDEHFAARRSLHVAEEHRVDPVFGRNDAHGGGGVARRGQDALEIERHADPLHLVARRSVAERFAPLGDVGLHDEERGVVEVLAGIVEEQIEDGVARRRLGELRHRLLGDHRAATPAWRALAGGRALNQRCRSVLRDDVRRGGEAELRLLTRARARGGGACRERRRARTEGGLGARGDRRPLLFGGRRRRRWLGRGGRSSEAREQALQPSLERRAVRPRQRLAHPHHRSDPLHELEPQRERQLVPHLFRERLGDGDDERAVLDPERNHRARRRHLVGHEPPRPLGGIRQRSERRRSEPERLGEKKRERRLVELGHLEQVRDQIAPVEHLASQRFLDLADRGDLALDDEGAQGHGEERRSRANRRIAAGSAPCQLRRSRPETGRKSPEEGLEGRFGGGDVNPQAVGGERLARNGADAPDNRAKKQPARLLLPPTMATKLSTVLADVNVTASIAPASSSATIRVTSGPDAGRVS